MLPTEVNEALCFFTFFRIYKFNVHSWANGHFKSMRCSVPKRLKATRVCLGPHTNLESGARECLQNECHNVCLCLHKHVYRKICFLNVVKRSHSRFHGNWDAKKNIYCHEQQFFFFSPHEECSLIRTNDSSLIGCCEKLTFLHLNNNNKKNANDSRLLQTSHFSFVI